MSTDAPVEGAAAPAHAAPDTGAVAELLNLCDRIIGELGRRQHLFSWLRAPDAASDDWLTVDAYYPASRIVVICRSQPSPHDDLYRELVPARGLRLLELSPDAIPVQRAAAEAALRRLIADMGPALERAREAPLPTQRIRGTGLGELAIARIVATLQPGPAPASGERRRVGQAQSAAVQRGARYVATHKARAGRASELSPAPSRAPRTAQRPLPARAGRTAEGPPGNRAGWTTESPASARAERATERPAPASAPPTRSRPGAAPLRGQRTEMQPLGVLFGFILASVVLTEAYVGVVRIGLDQGHVLLGFGLALDGCSRSLGTIAAAGEGRLSWVWWCMLGGSPAVSAFALFQPDGPVRTDPAPLAGLLSLLAVPVIAASLLLGL